MKLIPTILQHPNIPEALHHINPRTIEGKKWWNYKRQEVYASTNYHCIACGVHKRKAKRRKWLEAHEFWNIDYQTGECKIEGIYPLCHYCHNFIHSGRLTKLLQEEVISRNYVKEILEHGFEILSKNNLKCFPGTLKLANLVKANTFGVEPYELNINPFLKEEDFYLVWKGKKYKKTEESEII